MLDLFKKIVELLEDQYDMGQMRGPLEEFKRLSTAGHFPGEVVKHMNEIFSALKKPYNPNKRKVWNYLKATLIFLIGKSRGRTRSLSKEHAARTMQEINRKADRLSLLSDSSLTAYDPLLASMSASQLELLRRYRHNFVMDVNPQRSLPHYDMNADVLGISSLNKSAAGAF